ncbi:hypothetical protein WN48_07633 [Eufriesea mexicana]|uniref:Uncharacterized protein n=1 Tax=Eufriesea mexicana TaxID=516756 RepID=A0A310SJ84_9HYME|nr:hypothetical protein WN48_07633 [Eufriesea mexicana]
MNKESLRNPDLGDYFSSVCTSTQDKSKAEKSTSTVQKCVKNGLVGKVENGTRWSGGSVEERSSVSWIRVNREVLIDE